MLTKEVRTFLYVWVPLVLLLALAYRNKYYIGANPIVRPRLERIEPFVGAPAAVAAEKPAVEPVAEAAGSLAPADASLKAMRKPYALLGDVLEAEDNTTRPSLTSAACYDTDFQKRLEATGNYRQMTNNYKRGVPDSCSAPLHDLVLRQYKEEPIAFSGCLRSNGARPNECFGPLCDS